MAGICLVFAVACERNVYDEILTSDLEVRSVSAGNVRSKSVAEGSVLPDDGAARGVGLFLSGYDGKTVSARNNVRYYNSGGGWVSDTPAGLTVTPSRLYGYYPYNAEVASIDAVPVHSSLNGDDYMYAEPVDSVSSVNRVVDIYLKHALARLSVNFVRDASYSGVGMLTSLSLGGDGVADDGVLDATSGMVTATASGTSFLIEGGGPITDAGITEECLVVPVMCDTVARRLEIVCTIDGQDFPLVLDGDKAVVICQGIHSVINVCLTDEGLVLRDVWVEKWNTGSGKDVHIDGKRIVNIEIGGNVPAGDIIYTAYAEGVNLIIKAVSASGRSIECNVPDDCSSTLDYDFSTNIFTFTISDFIKETTAVLAYPEDDKVLERVRKDVVDSVSYFKSVFLDGGFGLDDGAIAGGYYYQIPLAIQDKFSENNIQRLYLIDAKKNNASDTTKQKALFLPDSRDPNGILFYPDGAPRFRMLFIHGGKSENAKIHGSFLDSLARENVREFFRRGGSVVTSGGAGTALAGSSLNGTVAEEYFHLYDGNVKDNGAGASSSVTITIPKGSALGEGYASSFSIPNLNGVYLDEQNAPEGVEILARYVQNSCTNQPAVWAYKPSLNSGRLVSCGARPDQKSNNSSDIYRMFCAELDYALAGLGCARVKGVLHNGEIRPMINQDGDPDYIGIGDMQCHYFVMDLKKDVSKLKIHLNWNNKVAMGVYLKKESFAFPGGDNDYEIESPSDKELTSQRNELELNLEDLPEGLWYVTVQCASELVYENGGGSIGYGRSSVYGKNTDDQYELLKGIPYSIVSSWNYKKQ